MARASVVDVARYGIERREIAFVSVWIVPGVWLCSCGAQFWDAEFIGGTEDIPAEQAHSSNFRNTLTTFARNFRGEQKVFVTFRRFDQRRRFQRVWV